MKGRGNPVTVLSVYVRGRPARRGRREPAVRLEPPFRLSIVRRLEVNVALELSVRVDTEADTRFSQEGQVHPAVPERDDFVPPDTPLPGELPRDFPLPRRVHANDHIPREHAVLVHELICERRIRIEQGHRGLHDLPGPAGQEDDLHGRPLQSPHELNRPGYGPQGPGELEDVALPDSREESGPTTKPLLPIDSAVDPLSGDLRHLRFLADEGGELGEELVPNQGVLEVKDDEFQGEPSTATSPWY